MILLPSTSTKLPLSRSCRSNRLFGFPTRQTKSFHFITQYTATAKKEALVKGILITTVKGGRGLVCPNCCAHLHC